MPRNKNTNTTTITIVNNYPGAHVPAPPPKPVAKPADPNAIFWVRAAEPTKHVPAPPAVTWVTLPINADDNVNAPVWCFHPPPVMWPTPTPVESDSADEAAPGVKLIELKPVQPVTPAAEQLKLPPGAFIVPAFGKKSEEKKAMVKAPEKPVWRVVPNGNNNVPAVQGKKAQVVWHFVQ